MPVKTNKQFAFLLIVVFGLLYLTISLFNHYLFKTFALDLGLYTNAIYKYAHLQFADCNVFKERFDYLLSDHFDLVLPLVSPLVYVFGTYTLLIVQIAFILIGGWGVYSYLLVINRQHSYLPLVGLFCFFSFYGIYSAISYDYHSNVIAAMLVPWLFYYLKKQNYRIAFFILLATLIAKENMSLWMIFVCLGLMIEYRQDKKAVTYLAVFTIFSTIYFVFILKFAMPKLASLQLYEGFRYSLLGKTPSEALVSILTRPFQSIQLLFINPTTTIKLDGIKAELHIFLLLSGLYLLVFKPAYLLMLLPIYIQKLYHDNPGMWGIGGQYSIEYAPILILGVISVMNTFTSQKAVKVCSILLVSGTLIATIRTMDNTVTHTNKSAIRFYQKAHYSNDFNVQLVHQQLSKLPTKAKISAQSVFVPHLALRDYIYQFPIIKDAEFIIFNHINPTYPLDKKDFESKILELNQSGNWLVYYQTVDLTILKRK